ncbi:MAG: discoidin domain-containing protein, partial [Clostridia bacterium]|nr:discoidin domain-containing protein [Clostridia bacterium]
MKLNKLLAGLGATILTAALAITVSAADPVVAWDFANADDTTLYNEDGTMAFSVNGANASYDAENACMTADVTNGDPYFQLPSRGDFPAENCYVRVKYYQSGISDWSTSIYFTTDTVAWSETGHWKGFYDGDDDEWCEQTFIMTECPAWAGTITGMRLDVFDAAYEGQLAKVAYVAVFGSEEDANNFDYAAWRAAGSNTTLAAPAADAAAEEPAAPGIGEAYPASGTAVPDGSVIIAGELIGSVTGWGEAAASGRHAAFDGNIETFFDPATASVDYCGIDAGEEMILTKIIIHPRTTFLDRFNGATIEASNDPDFNESVELYFSVEQAAEVAYIDCTAEMETAENTGYRYFRYINYMSHGDVAEVELYGYAKDGSNPDYSAGAAAPAASASAEGPELPATEYDSIANYAGIKPVIDGKIDAIWSATAAQESTWPGDLNGEGISGYTKILWDEDNLYFLGVVNDETTLQEANPTNTDSIDFWVSETYSDEIGYPLDGDYLLTLSPYNTVSGKGAEFANETAAVINGDGTYILEFSIPWLTKDIKPAAGTVFGFNASYNNDIDGDGVRDSWTSWVEWANMPYWSDTMWLDQVELVKVDIPVAVEETPAEEPAAAEPAVEEVSTKVEENLFTKATLVEVSGLEVEGSNTGDMAFDGDLATRWSSNTDDAAHIVVDLGAVTVVDSLDIYWETACAADYTVEVSEDNANWTVVATVTDNATAASPA